MLRQVQPGVGLGDPAVGQRGGEQGVESGAGERRQGEAAQAVALDAGQIGGALMLGGQSGEQLAFECRPAGRGEGGIADDLELQALTEIG